jgi:hypothetical protein
MTEYRLTVTREDINPEYDAQIEDWKRTNYYHAVGQSAPSRTYQRQVLDVTLTSEEYAVVKRAVLEVAK